MSSNPVAWVVNLDRCTENWARIQHDWKDTFDLQRVSAVDATIVRISGQAACRQSHLNLLRTLAAAPHAPYHIVMEDDVYKTAEWDILWPKLRQFLDEGRTDWDFIGLDPFLGFDSPTLQKFTDILVLSSAFRNTGFIIWNGLSLQKSISLLESNTGGAIDMLICRHPAFTKLIPSTLMVRQYTNKASTISCDTDMSIYIKYYNDTVKILAAFSKDD